jgi:hypothetical protein
MATQIDCGRKVFDCYETLLILNIPTNYFCPEYEDVRTTPCRRHDHGAPTFVTQLHLLLSNDFISKHLLRRERDGTRVWAGESSQLSDTSNWYTSIAGLMRCEGISTRAHERARIHIRTHTHARARVRTHTHTYIYIYIYTHSPLSVK